jgi:hypothetical protein
MNKKDKKVKKRLDQTEEQKEIFLRANENLKHCIEAENDIRIDAIDDIEFANGKHWTEDLLTKRKGRPCLTIDRLSLQLSQVCNEHRQNRASIKVRPFDSDTDPDKAEITNGIIRHIVNNSNTNHAIDEAFDYAVQGSRGFFRVLTEYVDDEAFEQEIKVKRIKNPLSVYFPVDLINEPDYSDAPYAFIREQISKKRFENDYPDIAISSFEENGIGDRTIWQSDKNIYICEYFEVVYGEPKTAYLLSDKTVVYDKETLIPAGIIIVNQREVRSRKIMWHKLCGTGILDSREWPSKYIPIIPILGKEINIDGKLIIKSLTRNAKDPQRMINTWKSWETEMIGLAPKVPYMVAEGQLEGHPEWKDCNNKNYSYLTYNPVTIGGQLAPPPQRTTSIGIDTGIVNAIRESTDDLMAATGIYPATLGAPSNESSGRAIGIRKSQGTISNYHFIDSATLATTYLGRILIDLLPKIYDTARMIRILGDDMQEKTVQITDDYFVDAAKYDMVVDVGADYITKRTEIVQDLSAIALSSPIFGELGADYIAQNLDIEGAQKLAERIRVFLNAKYPGLIPPKENADGSPTEADIQAIVADLQNVQQQLQTAGGENEQLKQIIGQLQLQLKDKDADRQTKIITEDIKSQTAIEKAKITVEPQIMANLLATVEHIRFKVDTLEKGASPAPAQPAGNK